MPDIPEFLASRAEAWFAHPCAVTEVVALAPRLRRVRFAGPALRRRGWRPGQEVEFRVGPRAFRHYTPMCWDDERGEVDIVFFLHGDGEGSRWAAGLHAGDGAHLMGPGGRLRLVPDAPTHVFLGDETTIGLFVALAHAAPAGALVTGAIEGDVGAALLGALGAPLDVVPRGELRGEALARWLEGDFTADAVYYLAGHAQSVTALRAALLQRRPSASARIRTKAYWADGRRGL